MASFRVDETDAVAFAAAAAAAAALRVVCPPVTGVVLGLFVAVAAAVSVVVLVAAVPRVRRPAGVALWLASDCVLPASPAPISFPVASSFDTPVPVALLLESDSLLPATPVLVLTRLLLPEVSS